MESIRPHEVPSFEIWEKNILSIPSWVLQYAQTFDFRKPLNESIIIISSHFGLHSLPVGFRKVLE